MYGNSYCMNQPTHKLNIRKTGFTLRIRRIAAQCRGEAIGACFGTGKSFFVGGNIGHYRTPITFFHFPDKIGACYISIPEAGCPVYGHNVASDRQQLLHFTERTGNSDGAIRKRSFKQSDNRQIHNPLDSFNFFYPFCPDSFSSTHHCRLCKQGYIFRNIEGVTPFGLARYYYFASQNI